MLIKTNHGPYLTVAHNGTFLMLRQVEGGGTLGTSVGQVLWNAMSQPQPMERVLAILASQGLDQTPTFAMVKVTLDAIHVVVRAGATVHSLSPEGERQAINGHAANTWMETTLPTDHEFAVTLSPQVPSTVPNLEDSCLMASAVATSSNLFTLGWVAPSEQERSHVPVPSVQEAQPTRTPVIPRPVVPEPAESKPVPRKPVLAPAPEPAPTEVIADESTILSSNLVQYRAQMAAGAAGPQNVSVAPVVVLSSGLRVVVDRPILIGRAPQAVRVSGKELPRLVTVTSPSNDISRTHVQVRCEGDLVLVTDLNSTNGVILVEPGQVARRLHPDEPTPVPSHAVVDLGDGVTFTVEAAQ